MKLDVHSDGRRLVVRGGWLTEEPSVGLVFGLAGATALASLSFMAWFFATEVARDGVFLVDVLVFLVVPFAALGGVLRILWRWSPRRRATFDLVAGRWRVEGAGPRAEGDIAAIRSVVVAPNGALLLRLRDADPVELGRSPHVHAVRRLGDELAVLLREAADGPEGSSDDG